MLSKNTLKLIHSLEKKKGRKQEGLFVAEGPKLVGELLPSFRLQYIAALPSWLEENNHLIDKNIRRDEITAEELSRASLLQHPQEVIALFSIPENHVSLKEAASKNLVLALDGVQDPGNLGTIIRLADWFGIEHVFCSTESADIYNPKAMQATMGAIAHVSVHYVDLQEELKTYNGSIYGTHLDGENLYNKELTSQGVIVMGNEGNGISTGVSQLVNSRLYIPPFPEQRETVESLNVAIATAIVCAEFRRREH